MSTTERDEATKQRYRESVWQRLREADREAAGFLVEQLSAWYEPRGVARVAYAIGGRLLEEILDAHAPQLAFAASAGVGQTKGVSQEPRFADFRVERASGTLKIHLDSPGIEIVRVAVRDTAGTALAERDDPWIVKDDAADLQVPLADVVVDPRVPDRALVFRPGLEVVIDYSVPTDE